jgi:hypothetical protein
MQYTIDSVLAFGLAYLVLFIYENNYVRPYTWQEIWPVGLGSYFTLFGAVLINYAIAHGKAGPS